MNDDDKPGIETTRPVVSLHRVPEGRLNGYRLKDLMEHGDGIKHRQRLQAAEADLEDSIKRFLRICPYPDRVREAVELALLNSAKA